MTDNNHPINSPPDELVEQWLSEPRYSSLPKNGTFVVKQCRSLADDEISNLVTKAARWGADQELDACCEWIYKLMDRGLEWSMDLRDARRPKPPSLKAQALEAVDALEGFKGVETIRRALESLPD